MKLFFYTILTLVIFQSCTPKIIQNNNGLRSFKKPINKLLNDSNLDVSIGIKMVALNTGITLYEFNSNKLFTPASNNKLFTLGAALHYLGSEYIFKTNVYTFNENLILKGSGDPDLSINQLDSLAYQTSKLIDSVDTLFLDANDLDSIYFGDGWMWNEGSWWYAAQVGALSLNDNCIDFIINPGKLGDPIKVLTYPKTDYISISNNSKTVGKDQSIKKLSINRDWINKTNHFTISGYLSDNSSPDTLKRNIEDPTLYTGTIFKEFLNRYGIEVKHISKASIKKQSQLIASHKSRSLIHSAKNLMNESDNLSAELFLKKIGSSNFEQGSWNNGLEKMKIFLHDSAKIDSTNFRMVDGSGLSRYNLFSASELTTFLEWVYRSQYKNDFISCLPTGGMKNGTMENRLPHLGEMLRVKTGGLSGVTNISGYIFSNNYGPIAFSILTNGYTGDSAPYRVIQDKIIKHMLYD